MKNSQFITVVLIAFAVTFSTNYLMRPDQIAAIDATPKEQTVLERVIETGVLRCGYFSWPPFMWKNPETGAFEGAYYDYMTKLAEYLDIEIDWAAEVVYANVYQEIRDGRIDAFCSGMWPTARTAKVLDYTTPIGFNAVTAFVRADDTRFDNNIATLDNADVTITSMEGSIAEVIAHKRFPRATVTITPSMAGPSASFLELTTNKADVVFSDWLFASEYMKNNPAKIKEIENILPLNVWGNTIAFGKGQQDMISAINIVTQEMIYSGEIEHIFAKHLDNPKALYRVNPPYVSY